MDHLPLLEKDECKMWKESYKLGVEKIDAQHQKLFEIAGNLVQEIEGAQRPEIYKKTIHFLQEYVVSHFQDEEAYFESLGFTDKAAHKKQHAELTTYVKKATALLEESDYKLSHVKRLAGALSAWLVYHVLNEDLKYTDKRQTQKPQKQSSYMEYFANSTIQVLETMAGLNPDEMNQAMVCDHGNQKSVFIEIGLIGDLNGSVVFGFTKDFSSRLVESMLSFTPEEIDELVCSALAEISNIASGNGTIAISEGGTACDIRPPKILQQEDLRELPPNEIVEIDTKIGKMSIAVYLD